MTLICKSKDVWHWIPIVVRKIFKVEQLSRLPHHVRRLEDPRRSEGAGQLPGRSQLHRGVSCLSSCGPGRVGWIHNQIFHLQIRTIIKCFRYVPSQADTQVYEALGAAPKDAHALRWWVQLYLDYVTLIVNNCVFPQVQPHQVLWQWHEAVPQGQLWFRSWWRRPRCCCRWWWWWRRSLWIQVIIGSFLWWCFVHFLFAVMKRRLRRRRGSRRRGWRRTTRRSPRRLPSLPRHQSC